jgi:hypothetical protein
MPEKSNEEKALEAELAAEEYISQAEVADERDEEFSDWDAASEEFPKAAKLWHDIGEQYEMNADRLAKEAVEEEQKGNDQIDAAGDPNETPAAQDAHRKSAKQHFAEGKTKHQKAAELYVRAAGQYRRAANDWERAAEADKNAAAKAPDSARAVKEADEAKAELGNAATEYSNVAKMYGKAAEEGKAAADKSSAEKWTKQAQKAQREEEKMKDKAKSSP